MKSLLTAGLMLFASTAFSQEIPNVWKYRGTDTIRYSIPLQNKPLEKFLQPYNQDRPFIIIPENYGNIQVYRMPVLVPPPVTVGLIPNPAFDPEYRKKLIAR